VSNSSCPSPAMAAFSAATILWNMFAHARWPEEKRCRGMKTTRRLKSRLNFPKWGKRIAHVHVPRCGLKIGLAVLDLLSTALLFNAALVLPPSDIAELTFAASSLPRNTSHLSILHNFLCFSMRRLR
jgi:hypothetical protein